MDFALRLPNPEAMSTQTQNELNYLLRKKESVLRVKTTVCLLIFKLKSIMPTCRLLITNPLPSYRSYSSFFAAVYQLYLFATAVIPASEAFYKCLHSRLGTAIGICRYGRSGRLTACTEYRTVSAALPV